MTTEPIHTVRQAIFADIEAVLGLYRELRPHDPPIPADRLPALWSAVNEDGRSSILVALVNDEIAATCMLVTMANLASDGRPIGLIEHVITSQRFRRQGLGRSVLAFALQQAWASRCCKVLLLSGLQRTEAHGVYESVGFKGDIEKGFVAKPPHP